MASEDEDDAADDEDDDEEVGEDEEDDEFAYEDQFGDAAKNDDEELFDESASEGEDDEEEEEDDDESDDGGVAWNPKRGDSGYDNPPGIDPHSDDSDLEPIPIEACSTTTEATKNGPNTPMRKTNQHPRKLRQQRRSLLLLPESQSQPSKRVVAKSSLTKPNLSVS